LSQNYYANHNVYQISIFYKNIVNNKFWYKNMLAIEKQILHSVLACINLLHRKVSECTQSCTYLPTNVAQQTYVGRKHGKPFLPN
jgi:hypothetical protein